MLGSLKQYTRKKKQQFKMLSLVTTGAVVMCFSASSHAGIISSSFGNALHIDLAISDLSPIAIDLGNANGTAPSGYKATNSLVDVDRTLPTQDPLINATADIFSAMASSTLENSTIGDFTTIGSSTIENLSFTLLQNFLPALDFINISNTTLSSTSKVDASSSSDGYVFSTAGSSVVESININILGNNITASVMDDSPIMNNVTLFDALGLGVFLNEATTSCIQSFCTEERSALRISFDSFSVQNWVTDILKQDFLGDDVLISGNIILASSQATTQVSEPSAALLLALGLGLIGRRRLFNKK
ncbi:hypothetical protein MTsDn1_27450 [Alteromonas sp. MTD1]|uniref:hypothetical protein n=1 Tax=Alteromonas sp. MTD1 TaxID=3057962 RepID=UPI0036F19549